MTRSTGGTQFFTIWVSLHGYLGAKWCLATLRASDLRESVEAIFLYDLSPEATYYLFLPYSVGHTATTVPSCYSMEREYTRI